MKTFLATNQGKNKQEQSVNNVQKNNPFINPAQMKTTNPFVKSNDVIQQMENSFQTDFSNVKIHTDSKKASDIGAQAFTQGNNIHFAQGKFDLSTKSGKQLLGHELSHVVQQRKGEVKPNTQINGMAVNDESGLENEADRQGALAAEGKLI